MERHATHGKQPLAGLIIVCALIALFTLGTRGSIARGQNEIPMVEQPKARIASLVSKLGSENFSERQTANEELLSLGGAAREEIELATKHQDPEIRLRAKVLLRELQIEDLWSATQVTIPKEPLAASLVIRSLAEQTGNRLMVGDPYGTFHDKELVLSPRQGAFWNLLDQTCLASGNRVRPNTDLRTPGLVVVSGNLGKYPVAYSGPMRLQINSARRAFSEELKYDELNSEVSHSFQFELQMMWEDRFRLIAYKAQPELVEGVTDNGQNIAALQPSGGSWNLAGPGMRQVTAGLRLHPPSPSAKNLALLHLKWGLFAVGDMASIEIPVTGANEPKFQDDVELNLINTQHGPGARCEVTLRMTRDVAPAEPQQAWIQENIVELFDAMGRPWRKQGETDSLTEEGVQIKATFLGDGTQSEPTTIRFSYPRIRSQRDLEFTFTGVPLPVATPH